MKILCLLVLSFFLRWVYDVGIKLNEALYNCQQPQNLQMNHKNPVTQVRNRPQRFGIDSIMNAEEDIWEISAGPSINGLKKLRTVQETLENMVSSLTTNSFDVTEDDSYCPLNEIAVFLHHFRAAKQAAANFYGWKGIFSDKPRVIWFPYVYDDDYNGLRYGFAWHDDNATAIIATPIKCVYYPAFRRVGERNWSYSV